MDSRKCQTPTATPPEAGDLPIPVDPEGSFSPYAIMRNALFLAAAAEKVISPLHQPPKRPPQVRFQSENGREIGF
jgi:hypothetical protein